MARQNPPDDARAGATELIPEDGRDQYDVVVVGGGPAGLGSAAAAASAGAKTLLLEGRPFLGGVGALTMWMPWNRILLAGESRGGVAGDFVNRVVSYGPDAYTDGSKHNFLFDDNLNLHPGYVRLAAFELLESAGCHYRLHSPVTEVHVETGSLVDVVTAGKGNKVSFGASRFIDTTGDCDVAYLAGVGTNKGRDDGTLMKPTLVFSLSEVDANRVSKLGAPDAPSFRAYVAAAKDAGYHTSSWYSFDRASIPNKVSVNNGGPDWIPNLDGTSIHDLSVAERAGTQIAIDFVQFSHELQIPGLENCRLDTIGYQVAVRDTRRIVGDYTVTREDAELGKEFGDAIARKYGGIDDVGRFKAKMKSGFGMPYRSMIPEGIDNLLVAGRCCSATHGGFAAGRSMGNMIELGQAAGTAAALSITQGIRLRDVDPEQVRIALRKTGVSI